MMPKSSQRFSDDIMCQDSRLMPENVQPFSGTIMREERAQA
jgi:hypothetical protein